MASTTTEPSPRVVHLSDYDGADDDTSVERPGTKPLVHTTPVTVLPRPYESFGEAAKQNPDYLGDSIWASVDLLPEPMVTGPAWRTHLTRNVTRPTPPTTTPTQRSTWKPTTMQRTTTSSFIAGW
ncbi:hypothetical protein Q1695_004444 [Nippostrongylus brasiliensis]|nr:hypothetical protein Q1695_004444 [Nippostrongylus brasiliensis]